MSACLGNENLQVELTGSQLGIFQNVKGRKLGRVHALQAQDLDAGAREAALWHFRGALHEQHYGCRRDGLLDAFPGLLGEEAELGGLEEDSGGAESGWPSGLPEGTLMGEEAKGLAGRRVRSGGRCAFRGAYG